MMYSVCFSSCKDDDNNDNQPPNNETPQNQESTEPKEEASNDDGFINATSLADEIAKLGVGTYDLKVNGELTATTLNSIGEALRAKYTAVTTDISKSKKSQVSPVFAVNLDLSKVIGLTKLETSVLNDGATFSGLAGCYALTSLKLPNTLTEIESNAVAYCINLANVTIPETVQTIADGSFFGCYKLEKNEKFTNLRGMVIEATDLGEKIKELTKGEYFIQVVGAYDNEWENEYAFFENCRENEIYINLDIADADTKAVHNFEGSDAFKEDWLKAIVWSMSAPKIECFRFSGSKSLNTVIIPESVTTIETEGLFNRCDNLKNIIIADPYGWKKVTKQKNETTGKLEDVEESIDKLTSDMLLNTIYNSKFTKE